MKSPILVVGKGYLGERISRELNCPVSAAQLETLSDCIREVEVRRPKILINAIGHTGRNNVDDCEIDKDRTLTANAFAPVMLAEACLRRGVRFVHISSGCIFKYDFSAQKPISEERLPDYYDLFYSRSKVYAERCLDYLSRRYPFLTVRIRIPLDDRPHPKNILDKLIRFRKISDLPNSVTYIPDFIGALRHLLRIRASGLYNVVNKGGLLFSDLLETYRKYVPGFSYTTVPFDSLKLRRTNLLLSTRKLERSGFRVRRIRDVLDECVQKYLSR